MSDHISVVRGLIDALGRLGRKRSHLDMRKKDWRALLQGGRVHDAVCQLEPFYDDDALPAVAYVAEEIKRPCHAWCELGKLANIALETPNVENLDLDDLDQQAEEHVLVLFEWLHAELRRLSDEEPLPTRDEICERTEDALSGQRLRLFRFLNKSAHWVSFDTLAKQEGVWRDESPTNEAIVKALKRLRGNIDKLQAPFHVRITDSEKRAKLEFLDPCQDK